MSLSQWIRHWLNYIMPCAGKCVNDNMPCARRFVRRIIPEFCQNFSRFLPEFLHWQLFKGAQCPLPLPPPSRTPMPNWFTNDVCFLLQFIILISSTLKHFCPTLSRFQCYSNESENIAFLRKDCFYSDHITLFTCFTIIIWFSISTTNLKALIG